MSALGKVICYSLLAISLLFIANFFIFTSPALAAADFKPLDSNNFNDSINVQRFYRNQLVTLHTIFLGTDPTGGPIYGERLGYVTENGQTKITAVPGLTSGSVNSGAIGLLGSTIVALYNPPTSSVEYLANLGENIGLSPKVANAQVTGSGAGVISPVLALWQVVRNISYAGFILVFITAGLMIMFRQKLNPQTVIGIQQALPGLVIGLILVTFSYFIAAFIVDLAFVGTGLVAAIFDNTGAKNYYNDKDDKTGSVQKVYKESNAFNMYGSAATRVQNVPDIFGGVWGVIGPKNQPKMIGSPDMSADYWKNALAGATVGAVVGSIVPIGGTFAGAIGGGILGVITGLAGAMFNVDVAQAATGGVISLLSALLIPIILMIALMIQFIKLILALLMSYIQILIMVIAGPLFILFSAIPGRGGVLGYWLKNLVANVLIFPAVFAGFLFAGLLLESNIGSATMPLFGSISTEMIKPLLAFGVLLGLPSIPDMVRKALGAEGPQGFAQAAMGGFMSGVNTGRSGVTGGWNQATERTGIRAQQQAYQKAKLEGASSAYTYDPTTGGMTGGPTYSRGPVGWVRRRLVERS